MNAASSARRILVAPLAAALVGLSGGAGAQTLSETLAADRHLFQDVINLAGDDAIAAVVEDLKENEKTKTLPFAVKLAATPVTKEAKRQIIGSLVEASADSADASAKQEARRTAVGSLTSETLDKLARVYTVARANLERECASKRPRIHNIGTQAIYTFESADSVRPLKAGERAVRIPIDGYDLSPRCVTIGVQIGGTMQVTRWGAAEPDKDKQDFFVTEPSVGHPDTANIILLEPFIDRLKTGDKVSVAVSVSNRYAKSETEQDRRVTFPKRIFTMYSVAEYRRLFLASRIGPHDFMAFPLPEEEAKGLFGPLVSRHYFVVRLSIRNTDAEAKLVSTGMIRAAGTARVEPKASLKEPAYAVPVSVVPHSLSQIYKLIQDEEVDQPRARTFRGLELFGALATGIGAITSAGLQATRNLGFFTGIFIPESKKAWPDRWPGYQANIVNFAMPDLMKVPSNSVADHKFLFFSKQEIDGLVSDPNLFAAGTILPGSKVQREDGKPDAFVISLEFDNLDIRFEKVFQVATVTTRDQTLDLGTDLAKLLANMAEVKDWYSSVPKAQLGMTTADWTRLQNLLAEAETAANSLTGNAALDAAETKSLQEKAFATIRKLLNAMKAGDRTTALYVDLLGPGKFSEASLAAQTEKLRRVTQRLNAGADPEMMKDQVDEIAKVVNGNKTVLRFYQGLTRTLLDSEANLIAVRDALRSLGEGDTTAPTKKKLTDAAEAIAKSYSDFGKMAPAEGVSFVF